MSGRYLATVAALAFLAAPTWSAEVVLPAKSNFEIFILAGQSNMAGRGKLDDESRQPKPRIFALNKDGQWQPAVDPLHWDKPAAGTGIGRPFAEIIAARFPSDSIGLVPTACGGSPISTWSPGQSWKQTNSNPWDDAIARARRAMQDGTVKAILWHQGESDSTEKDAPLYAQRLEDLITRFRTELGVPDLPFIIGQIGRFPAKPWDAHREAVDAAQRAVAKKMKKVRFVPAENLTSIGDSLHFDTPSLRVFGKGYADAYLDILGEGKR